MGKLGSVLASRVGHWEFTATSAAFLTQCLQCQGGPCCAADTRTPEEQQCVSLHTSSVLDWVFKKLLKDWIRCSAPITSFSTAWAPCSLHVLWKIPAQDPTPQLQTDSLHLFNPFFLFCRRIGFEPRHTTSLQMQLRRCRAAWYSGSIGGSGSLNIPGRGVNCSVFQGCAIAPCLPVPQPVLLRSLDIPPVCFRCLKAVTESLGACQDESLQHSHVPPLRGVRHAASHSARCSAGFWE